jgi:hypothetical protein
MADKYDALLRAVDKYDHNMHFSATGWAQWAI